MFYKQTHRAQSKEIKDVKTGGGEELQKQIPLKSLRANHEQKNALPFLTFRELARVIVQFVLRTSNILVLGKYESRF